MSKFSLNTVKELIFFLFKCLQDINTTKTKPDLSAHSPHRIPIHLILLSA